MYSVGVQETMRPSRMRPRVLAVPARGRIAIHWAVPGAALALAAAVALIFAIVGLAGTSSAQLEPIDPAHLPWVAEGPVGRSALRTGWTMAVDPLDQGQRLGWSTGRFGGQAVTVPSVANAQPVTGQAGIRSYAGSVAWYRRTLTLPHDGVYALRFESVNFRATVWLDGRRLGGHVGTYLPFELRFNGRGGPHTLVVRVDWRSPQGQTRLGFHRTWFNFGGINREVTIRPVGPSDVVAPTIHTVLARAADGSTGALVKLTAEVHNYGPARTVNVSGKLERGDQSFDLNFPSVSLPTGGSAVVTAKLGINSPALWSPDKPALYDLNLKVGDESEYRAKVGLREVTWSGTQMYLNGRPLKLHGASLQEDIRGHGDALTPSDQLGLVNELKAVGANATRSQHPLDLGLLEKCDAAGIILWQGVGPVDSPGSWNSSTPGLERLAEKRVRITVRQAQAHPSIIAWNLANELANNGHTGGQIPYAEHMATWLHANDPGRLVALDLWGQHPPQVPGPIYDHIDAIGETNYLGWYERPTATTSQLQSLIANRLNALHRVFPRKVLIVSEFGGEANYLNQKGLPGGYDFQARLLRTHITTYAQLSYLSGMLVWDLRDFAVAPSFAGGSIRHAVASIQLVRGLNQKGLISYEGSPKPAFAVVRNAFQALGGTAAY